jgi:3-oxoacyl-[acyl-carrier protein] reductase
VTAPTEGTGPSGRGVLVTGASGGIGAAVARAFAEHGDRVVLHHRSGAARAQAVLDGLPGSGHALVAADLADPREARRLSDDAVAALGRVDVLVNNAGIYLHQRVDPAGATQDGGGYDAWVDSWRQTIEVNLLGPANLTFCVASHMLAVPPAPGQPRGRVVNIGSRGAYRGEPTAPAYAASKAGLHAFGQSLAVALAPDGIAVVSLAPGFVATDMAAELLAGPEGDAVRAQSPFGRVAEPGEIAAAVIALAEPAAEWASGTVVDFNGASYLH